MSAAVLSESGPGRPGSSASPAPEEFSWRVLRLLNVFRIFIASILTLAFLVVDDPRVIGASNPTLASIALAAVMLFAILEIPLLYKGWLGARIQIYVNFAVDLGAFAALAYASGAGASGLAGVLVVSVGCLSLLLPGRLAFSLAAVAAITLLFSETYAVIQGVTSQPAFAPTGILGAVIFVVTTIVQLLRERMVQSEALAEQRGVDLRNLVELNDYIIQHLRESIVVVDGDNQIRLINESAAKLLGTNLATGGGDLDDTSTILALCLERWREGKEGRRQKPIPLGEDGSATIQPHFARLGDDRGEGVVIFLEDTSLLQEKVQQTKLAALGRLSASIAHEIRNPLGALSHASQLLAETAGLGPDEHRLTDIIRINSKRVSQIVDSVLSLSRSDRISPERIELVQWATDFAAEFTATQELFEGAVTVDPRSAAVDIEMDRTHLHQVVWNLCDNAVKYASEAAGAIAVEFSCGVLDSSERPFLDIADRGPGIDPEMIDQVFEPFYTAQPGGTGLGLYISRELCERNSATLRYHAREGGGSVFRIVFADPKRWQVRAP